MNFIFTVALILTVDEDVFQLLWYMSTIFWMGTREYWYSQEIWILTNTAACLL